MNHRTNFLLAAVVGLLLTSTVRADGPGDIAVYLTPDATTPALIHVKPDDARLASAKPADDAAKAAAGWQTFSLAGPITGYVPTNSSRKDFSVFPGTPVHQAPDSQSPTLGTAPFDPTIALKSVAVDWSTVDFPGPVTVYFIKTAAGSTVATSTPTPAAPIPAPTPVTAAPAAQPSTATAVTAVPADPTEAPRYFYGVLKQRINPTIGGPVNAQFLLEGDKGQIVALVDLNNVILPNPVMSYLNKPAKIYGAAYNDKDLPYAIINALSLQSN